IARAISSLPVPVSPWTRTVESVGATRSTCSSTDSRAGLLPMICSNLRGLASWPADPNLATAATEDLLVQSDANFDSRPSFPEQPGHFRAMLRHRTVLP